MTNATVVVRRSRLIGAAILTSFIGLDFLPAPASADNTFPCLIEPRQLLKLATPVTGVVAKVNVDRGDRVTKGEIVAELEDDVEEANAWMAQVKAGNDTAIRSGRARLDFLRRKQHRNDQLRTTDAVSFAQADEATADALVAEASLREAELNLAIARLEARRAQRQLLQRRILSPINGVVVERTLGPGEFSNDQAHILTVAELDPLRVEAYLPISMYRSIKVGDAVAIHPETPVNGNYTAVVTVVDQVLDAASGTIGVRLELANPGYDLPAGIHCTATVQDKPAHK